MAKTSKLGLDSLQLQHWMRAVNNGKEPTERDPATQEIKKLPLPLARADGGGLPDWLLY